MADTPTFASDLDIVLAIDRRMKTGCLEAAVGVVAQFRAALSPDSAGPAEYRDEEHRWWWENHPKIAKLLDAETAARRPSLEREAATSRATSPISGDMAQTAHPEPDSTKPTGPMLDGKWFSECTTEELLEEQSAGERMAEMGSDLSAEQHDRLEALYAELKRRHEQPATLTPSAPIAAPVRDDGARERIAQAIHDHNFRTKGGTVPWSVILQYPRYRESYEAKKAYGLTDAILAALCLTPASNVPGEAQTHASGWKNEHCNGEPEAAETSDVLVSGALADIATERRRQVEAEGWSPAHDDKHTGGEMAAAAACYALSHGQRFNLDARNYKTIREQLWPWDEAWWKPGDRRRELVKACALLVAEIERLDRATLNNGGV